jgi:hypothetical protein
MTDKVTEILCLMKTLWDLTKEQYIGLQEIQHGGGKITQEELDNKFANFFSSHVVDTSVGGNLSPLFHWPDQDLIEELKEQIEKETAK